PVGDPVLGIIAAHQGDVLIVHLDQGPVGNGLGVEYSDDRGHGVGPGVVEPLDEEVSVVDTPADVDVSSVDVLRLGVGGRGAAGLDLEYFSPPLGGSDDVGGEAPLGVQGQSQVHLLAARHV